MHSFSYETNLHMKSCAPSLAFITRFTATGKWPNSDFFYTAIGAHHGLLTAKRIGIGFSWEEDKLKMVNYRKKNGFASVIVSFSSQCCLVIYKNNFDLVTYECKLV